MTTIKIYSNSILEIDGSVVLRSSLSKKDVELRSLLSTLRFFFEAYASQNGRDVDALTCAEHVRLALDDVHSFGALEAIYRLHSFLKTFAMSSYYCGLYKVSIV